jgi:hypothetical protein
MRSLQDLRFSIRTLRKSPGFALTALLTLGLGIGSVTSVFSVVNSVLLKPFAFRDPGRLVVLREEATERNEPPGPDNYQHYLNWKTNAKALTDAAIFRNRGYSVSADADHPNIVEGLEISPNLFSVLGVQPVLGGVFYRRRRFRGTMRRSFSPGAHGRNIFTLTLTRLGAHCASAASHRPSLELRPRASASRT